MRKILFIFTLIFMTSVFAPAQVETKSSESWKPFAPAGEEFSVEVPESFGLMRFSPNDSDAWRLYKTFSGKTYFFIASDKIFDLSQSKIISSLAEKNNATGASVVIGNFQGSEYSFTDEEGFYQKILVVKGKARSYIFHAVGEMKDNPDVERFFSSLRLDRILPEEKKISEKQTKSVAQTNSTQKSENNGSGSEMGNGSGSGSNSGNGTGAGANQANQPVLANQTAELKIASKPRPNYTDLARLYEISGVVSVRVTFLASGEIGTVEPVNKLPFGLTATAIAAARAIRFQPPMRNGTAYSVVKLVQYSFTIY